jgi:ribosomal protein S19E (S16A)
MLTVEKSLYEIANTDAERESFDKVLPKWWHGWRASIARKKEGGKAQGAITYMPDPRGWKQMERHPHAEEFRAAAEAEIEKLESMGAGEDVPGGRKGVPPGAQILRSIFTFVTKRMADAGDVEKFKARCVADGSKQTDTEDTHAPTIGATTLRTLLAVSVAAGHVRSTADV